MKKVFIFAVALFMFIMPFSVFAKDANIVVTNIEFVAKSDHVSEEAVASIQNGSLNFNLEFWNVDDFITYRVTFQNNEKEDYFLNIKSDDPTLAYVLSDNKITKNSTSTIDVTVKYAQKVSNANLGKTVNTVVPIDVQDRIGLLVNPKTARSLLPIIMIIIAILSVILSLRKTRSFYRVSIIILFAISMIPFIVSAEEYNLSIHVTYNIKDVRGLRYKGELIENAIMESYIDSLKPNIENICYYNPYSSPVIIPYHNDYNDPYDDFQFHFANGVIPLFEPISENSADVTVPITAFYGDEQNTFNRNLYFSVSIETDAETGDSRVVFGECEDNYSDSSDEFELFLPYLTFNGENLTNDDRDIFESYFSQCYALQELFEDLDSECVRKLIGESNCWDEYCY